MPEVKFLNQRDSEPYLYLDELQFNRDRIKAPVYVVPDPLEWSYDNRHSGDPFRFDDDRLGANSDSNRGSHRMPNPSRSRRTAVEIAQPDQSRTSGEKHKNRVTIRWLYILFFYVFRVCDFIFSTLTTTREGVMV
jgi:hypothetical protein